QQRTWMEETRMETPLFKHHCKYCIFLGTFGPEEGVNHDLYFCPSPGDRGGGQVVSRWGEDSEETDGFLLGSLRSEGGERMLEVFPAIREALSRAEAGGLAGQ